LDAYVYDALQAGASGFMLKDAPPEEIAAAVRIVANGDALLAPAVTRAVIEEFARRRPAEAAVDWASPALDSLTPASARCSTSWPAASPIPRSATGS
jgi:DNA-binding NarL/FixJ family response regulator